jgi:hypothetical protein
MLEHADFWHFVARAMIFSTWRRNFRPNPNSFGGAAAVRHLDPAHMFFRSYESITVEEYGL